MSTLTDFRTMIKAELGLDTLNSGSEQTECDRRVNEGVLDILRKTECYVTSATMTETSSTGDYDLDTAILRVKGWLWAGTGSSSVPERVSPQEIERMRAASVAVVATPASYYAVAGANRLMVYPTPGASDVVTIYYVPRPTAMTDGAHDPSDAPYGGIPEEFHPAIESYALAKLASMDDDDSSQQGMRYRAEYQQWVKDIRREVNLKAGPLPRAVINPNRRLRHNVYGRNDIY
jgi:hypothetical protein